MNVQHTVGTIAALAAGAIVLAAATPAFAEDAPSPTRAQVKAETRAALKAHEIPSAGEGSAVPEIPFKSTKTRSQRKSETVAARKAGDLLPAGEAQPKTAPFHSEKTRQQRKSETLAAAKAKKLTPAGESIDPPRR